MYMYLVYFRYLGGLSRPAPKIGSLDGEVFFFQWGVFVMCLFYKAKIYSEMLKKKSTIMFQDRLPW